MNFIIKHNIPILDEHILYDDEGNEITTLDERKLKHIADLANKRVRETGDLCPIVIGHTKDDTDEEDQPQIVGWASNFKVQRFLKTGRKAITVTMKFLKRCASKVAAHPRRSIELWLNDWKIDPISLLGATTPERDLGLLKLSKSGVRKFSIPYKERIPMQENTQESQIVKAVMKALEQSDVWQWVQSKMQEEGTDEEPVDEGGLDQQPPMDDEEDERETFGSPEMDEEDDAAQDLTQPKPPEEEEPMRMAQKEPKPMKCAKKKNMKQDQNRIRMSRLEKVVQGAQREVKGLRLKLQKAERERDLIQLEAEGVEFDREEELEDLMALPDTLYQKHLNKMRVRYAKAPVTFGHDQRDNAFNYTREQAVLPSRKAVSDQAVALASEKGIPFDKALAMIEGD